MSGMLPIYLLVVITGSIAGARTTSVSKANQHNDRIVGGHLINITQVPWQVSLQYEGRAHICGGSIIDNHWILTAGHCIGSFTNNPVRLRVHIGLTNVAEGEESLRVAKLIIHPRYNSSSLDFDYGLIQLKDKITFNAKKQPITLFEFGDAALSNDAVLFVSGWGSTRNSTDSKKLLRGVDVPLVQQKLCNDAYNGTITSRMICAGDYDNGGRDSCQGDSGGPLVAFVGASKEPVLVGIVSSGEGCAVPKYPGIYARVLAAREWINSYTKI